MAVAADFTRKESVEPSGHGASIFAIRKALVKSNGLISFERNTVLLDYYGARPAKHR